MYFLLTFSICNIVYVLRLTLVLVGTLYIMFQNLLLTVNFTFFVDIKRFKCEKRERTDVNIVFWRSGFNKAYPQHWHVRCRSRYLNGTDCLLHSIEKLHSSVAKMAQGNILTVNFFDNSHQLTIQFTIMYRSLFLSLFKRIYARRNISLGRATNRDYV